VPQVSLLRPGIPQTDSHWKHCGPFLEMFFDSSAPKPACDHQASQRFDRPQYCQTAFIRLENIFYTQKRAATSPPVDSGW
jgi:hypothetical protein